MDIQVYLFCQQNGQSHLKLYLSKIYYNGLVNTLQHIAMISTLELCITFKKLYPFPHRHPRIQGTDFLQSYITINNSYIQQNLYTLARPQTIQGRIQNMNNANSIVLRCIIDVFTKSLQSGQAKYYFTTSQNCSSCVELLMGKLNSQGPARTLQTYFPGDAKLVCSLCWFKA